MKQGPYQSIARGRPCRIVSIVGTRPEAIKMGPLVRALGERRWAQQEVVLTGQHSGLPAMFGPLGGAELRELDCEPRGRTAIKLRETLHRVLSGHLKQAPADLVLVQGDTASAFAGALAARDCGIPLGHVEAGLRSFNLRQPWPEEGNRMAIDAFSDLLFAPTEAAARNLAADWRVKGRVFVTGNTGIDALLQARRPVTAAAGDEARKTILVTCHRKENQGEPLRSVCAALKRLVRELPLRVVLPLHPNRHVRGELEPLLAGEEWISMIEPLGHAEMVALMDRSWLLLTDSGGLQEEGPALGKPVLVLRNVTERGEAVETDNVALVGTETEAIVAAVTEILHDAGRYASMARPSLPFGDGRASARIADAIEAWSRARRRAA